jgi:cytochrome c biogenesis protein CcmG/thiol:disulfide interchange protein DsbE
MMKGKQIILLAVLVVIAAVIVFGLKEAGNGKKVVAVGIYAPDFSVVDATTGKTVSSSDLRGKVVFVHFWATWCSVCNEEMPTVNALAADAASNADIRMITILYRDTPENGAAYMKAKGYSFPVFTDPGDSASKNFGITGVPETYIIDKKGVLRRKVIGEADWNAPEERQFINSLLKG